MYKYSIIKFVPNPIRGEYINIGLCVGTEDDWRIEFTDKRACVIDEFKVLPTILVHLGRIKDEKRINDKFFQDSGQSIIQYTTPKLVLGDDPDKIFDMMWEVMVE